MVKNTSNYPELQYTCEYCEFEITGCTADPQEAPWFDCPDCGHELNLEVEHE